MNPHEELVHHDLGLGAQMAQQIYQADAVQMAVDVIGDDDKGTLRELREAFGMADTEVYPEPAQEPAGKLRPRRNVLVLHPLVNLVHVVYTGEFQTYF